MLIPEIIASHLATHRRLTVPAFGTFLAKETPEGHDILFSELLKADDGVLRELVMQRQNVSEIEAAGAIDRFVFEVRHALTQYGYRDVPPLGRLVMNEGVIALDGAVARVAAHRADETEKSVSQRPAMQDSRAPRGRRKRVDIFTWVGIVVIVLSLALIAYTYWSEKMLGGSL